LEREVKGGKKEEEGCGRREKRDFDKG